MDPSLDPELALALRVSMEEERARQEALSKQKAEGEGGEASASGQTDAAMQDTPAQTPGGSYFRYREKSTHLHLRSHSRRVGSSIIVPPYNRTSLYIPITRIITIYYFFTSIRVLDVRKDKAR